MTGHLRNHASRPTGLICVVNLKRQGYVGAPALHRTMAWASVVPGTFQVQRKNLVFLLDSVICATRDQKHRTTREKEHSQGQTIANDCIDEGHLPWVRHLESLGCFHSAEAGARIPHPQEGNSAGVISWQVAKVHLNPLCAFFHVHQQSLWATNEPQWWLPRKTALQNRWL